MKKHKLAEGFKVTLTVKKCLYCPHLYGTAGYRCGHPKAKTDEEIYLSSTEVTNGFPKTCPGLKNNKK